jgi:hypothetical protein
MPVVSDAAIKKHWIVTGFNLPESGVGGVYGSLGSVEQTLYGDIESAKNRAKELAAEAPGAYFVVYEAMWYAFTDITPVTLRRVGLQIAS